MRRIRHGPFAAAAVLLAGCAQPGWAQEQEATVGEATEKPFAIHFQFTSVTQAHPSFSAPYSGQNSLLPESERETTVTSTLFLGARLWKGAELHVNPEMTGGSGLSKTFGIAGFPNGEAFRVESPQPHIFLARLVLKQTFALSSEAEAVEDEANQLGGRRPVRRLTISVGRFGLTDFFDDDAFSHDPRSQFQNWAAWTSGSWDYPADTRGYTWGFVAEYAAAGWAARLGGAAVAKVANGLEFDKDLLHAHGFAAEAEKTFTLNGQPGTARAGLFYNRARMGSYREAIDQAQGQPPDIVATRQPGRTKWGFFAGLEQALGSRWGLFLRASWNDGHNEAWMYAEIERSLCAGAVRREPISGRAQDEAGLAFIVNGLSRDHQDYLAAGGYGFMIGDGKLAYGPEIIAELYYRALVVAHIWLSGDYQFVANPAYNRARGPVHVFGLRLHAEL